MLKRFNIYELDYKLIHFIASAERFRRAHPRLWLAVIFDWFFRIASSVDTQIACRWNLVALRVVRTRCYRFGTTWGGIINDRIFIFGWTIPLRITQLECYLQIKYHPIQTNLTFEVKKLTLLAKQTSCLTVVVTKHSLKMIERPLVHMGCICNRILSLLYSRWKTVWVEHLNLQYL